jgi:hypothetical protein
MSKMTLRARRAAWLLAHADEYKAARVLEEGSSHNARYRRGMSDGGWGYWVQAIRQAGLPSSAQNYWSGSAPTPSTAINKGYADYILANAPKELLQWTR